MTDDLVKRLRKEAEEWLECCGDIHVPLQDAANRIEELEAENKLLRLQVVHANDTADVAINQVRILVGKLAKEMVIMDALMDEDGCENDPLGWRCMGSYLP